MILSDANLLLYAYDRDSGFHRAALGWLESCLSSSELFGLSWQTVTAFLRISTSHRVFVRPLSGAEATKVVTDWLALPNVTMLTPGPRHWNIFSQMLSEGQASGPLVMDAHLAALAVEHGAVLYTTDRDFTRFPNLGVVNPLVRAK